MRRIRASAGKRHDAESSRGANRNEGAFFVLLCLALAVHASTIMSLEDYLNIIAREWFLTGKTRYTVQAMMVSKPTSFLNDLEMARYTATDDGFTVVLRGTGGEMWTSRLEKVISTSTASCS